MVSPAWKVWIARLLVLAQFWSVLPAAAQQVPLTRATNAPIGKQPLIDRAANGVPLVLLAPPSAQGVSHNIYEQFNVGSEGLILNNSTARVPTQLGGWINGNLQYGKTAARLIVNEVNSIQTSALKGMIEVGGQAADVVVANPNGISCDGCGFLNTSGRATLTTGQPQFAPGGGLSGFDVRQGVINIGAAGLNAASLDQLDLIARGLIFDGEVYARHLNLVTGANRVLYGDLSTLSQQGTGPAPGFAIDVARLGGMYVNQIYLVANELGLGVNSQGRIAVLDGALDLSVQGDLTLRDGYAKQGIKLGADKVALSGQTQAEQDIFVGTPGGLINSGTMQAGRHLVLDAPTLANTGSMTQLASDQPLALNIGSSMVNSGTVYSPGNLILSAPSISGSGGQLLAAGGLSLTAGSVDFDRQRLVANQDLSVLAGSGGLRHVAGSADAGGDLTLSAAGGDASIVGSKLAASGQLKVRGERIVADDAQLAAAGNLTMASIGAFSAQRAQLATAGDLRLSADAADLGAAKASALGQLDIAGGKSLAAPGASLAAQGDLSLSASRIAAAAATLSSGARLKLAGKDIDLTQAKLSGATRLTIAGGSLNLDQAQALSGGDLTLSATTALGRKAVLAASHDLIIAARGGLDLGSAVVEGQNALTLQGQGISTAAASIAAPRVSLDAGSAALDNRAGAILASASGDALSISATGVDNSKGQLASNGALRLDLRSATLTNDGGTIAAPHATLLNLSRLSNRQGKLYADDDLLLSGFALDNNGGLIDTAGKLTIKGAGLDNSAGVLYAKGAIGIDTGSASLQNPGGIIDSDAGGVMINAASVDNSVGSGKPGVIVAAGDVKLQTSGALFNQGGRIAAGGSMTLDSAAFASDGGSLQSVAGLKLTTGALSLDKGELLSQGDVSLQAGEVSARQGAINAGGALRLTGTNLLANSAQISGGGTTLWQFTGKITLDGGSVDSQGALTTSSAALSARQAQLRTNADLSVDALDADLGDARLAAAGNVQLRFEQLQAAGASVAAGGSLDLVANTVRGGLYSALKDVSVSTAQTTDISAGGLLAGGNVSVRANGIVTDGAAVAGANVALDAGAGGLSNIGGEIVAVGAAGGDGSGATLSITAHGIDNRRGTIASNDRASIDTQGQLLDNSGGLLQARRSLQLDAGQIRNRGGDLASPGAIAIRSQGFDNAGGSVQSGGNISIDTQGQDLDNNAGLILAEGNAQLNSGRLLNAAGTIQANGTVNVAADSVDNQAGNIITGRDLTVVASGAIASAQGKLISGSTLNISGLSISADGAQISSKQDANIQADQELALAGASITVGGALSLNGVGISADGAQMSSQQGTRIQAGGNLALGHGSISAGGDVAINADGAVLAPGLTIAGKANVNIAATAALDVSGGNIAAGGNATLSGTHIDNSGGTIGASGNASLSGTHIDNSGGIIDADGTLSLSASQGELNNDGGRITSRTAVTLNTAAGLNNAAGTIESAAALAINATELKNRDGRIYVQGPLAIRTGALDNTRGTLAAALGDLDIDSGGKDYSGALGGLFANGNLSLKSAAVDAAGGAFQAGGSLKLQATQIAGAASSMLAATGDMNLDAGSGVIDLSGSKLQSAGGLTLHGGQTTLDRAAVASGKDITLAIADLNMGQSRFDAAGALSMTSSGEIRGAGSQLYANGRIGVQASAFAGGIVSAGGDVAIATTGLTDVSGGALLAGEGMGVSVQARGIRVDGATVSGNTVLLDAGGALLSARGGKILATSQNEDALRISSVGLDNSDGQIATNGSARIGTGGGDLNDNHGWIGAARGLSIAAGAVDNRGGMISSENGITLSTTALDNSGGTVQSGQRLSLTTPGHDLGNRGGMLLGMTGVEIVAGALDNSSGSVLAGGALTLTAGGKVANDQGQMISDAALTLSAASASNAGGLISSGLSLQLASAGNVDNSQGRILSAAELSLVAQGLANNAGQVASGGAIDLQLGSFALTNRAGEIRSSDAGVSIVSGGVDSSRTDQAASIIAATVLSLASTGDVDNSGSNISAGTGLTLNASGRLSNSGASLIAGGDAAIVAAEVDNSGGAIGAAGNLVISASTGAIDNSAASITAGQDLSLGSQGLHNGTGSVASGGNLAIDAGAGALDNRAGKIIAQGTATVRATGVDNREAQIAANGDVAIAAAGGALDTRAGEIRSAQGGLTLSAASIDSNALGGVGSLLSASGNVALTSAGDWMNDGSRLTAGGKLAGQAGGRISNIAGLIAAGGDASLSGRGLDNSGGKIHVDGALTIDAASGALSNAGGLISSAARLTLTGGAVNNSDGQMLAAAGAEIRTAGFNNLRGGVAANDDLLLHAGSGTLDNSGGAVHSARGNLALTSGDLINGASNGIMGLIAAAQDIAINASGSLDNRNNEIAAGRDLSVAASGLVHNSQGRLLAARNLSLSGLGLENDGGLTGATGAVSLTAGASGIGNRQGQIVAQQDLDIRSSGDLTNYQGAILSGGNLTLASGALNNAAGQISAADSAKLTATSLVNSSGASIVAGQNLTLDAGAMLDNSSGTLAANGDLALKGATVRISGNQFSPGGRLSVRAETIDAADIRIEAGAGVSLDAGSGTLDASASDIKAGQDIRISGGTIGLNSSTIAANSDISVSGRSIDAGGASVTTPGNLSLTADQTLLYANAALAAGVDLTILTAGHAESRNAQLLAGRNLSLATSDAFDFNAPGLSIRFGRDLSLRAEGISTQGYTLTANNLTLDAGSGLLNNDNGHLQAVDGLSVSGAGIDNRGGTIAANSAVSIDAKAGRFDNSNHGLAYSNQSSMSIAAGSIDNRTGEIDAHDSISLRGGNLDNRGSNIIAGGGVSVALSADLNNSSGGQLVSNAGAAHIVAQGVNNSDGNIAGASDLLVDAGAGALDNSGGKILSAGTATMRAGSIANTASATRSAIIQAGGALDIATAGLLDNRGSTLLSKSGNVTLGVAHLDNSAHGAVSSGAALTINAGQLDNGQGLLVANGQLSVNASGAVDNSGAGKIISNGGVSLHGLTLDNRTGTVSAVQALQVELAGALDNRGGAMLANASASVSALGIDNRSGGVIAAQDNLSIDSLSGALNNSGGILQSNAGGINLRSASLDNRGGTLSAVFGALAVNTGALDNTALDSAHTGLIQGKQIAIDTMLQPLNNAGGVISGLDAVSITSGALNNDAGVIESGGGISIDTNGNRLNNRNSGNELGIVSRGDISIKAGLFDQTNGYTGASGKLDVEASEIDNSNGTLLALGGVKIKANDKLTNRGGNISAGTDLTITSPLLDNSGGTVFAGANATLNIDVIDNSNTRTDGYTQGLLAGGNMAINAQTINNSNGAIVARGDVNLKVRDLLRNEQGQIGGNSVSIDAPRFQNSGGRADAAASLTVRTPSFSADGVLASNGSLAIAMNGDYTNTGTLGANGDLSISTSGNYTNLGTVSSQQNLRLDVHDLTNAATAKLLGNTLDLKASGTLTNDGLIDASGGRTHIDATQLDNAGRIYGDVIDIQAQTLNNKSLAVIASRIGPASIAASSLNNDPNAQLLSMGDMTLTGNLRNNGGMVSAAYDLSITGGVSNTNAGLQTQLATHTEPVNLTYYQSNDEPNNDPTKYRSDQVVYLPGANLGGGFMVRPSDRYPFASFGAEPMWLETPATTDINDIPVPAQHRPYDDPVWALLNVPPPPPPPNPPPEYGSCMVAGAEGVAERIYDGGCWDYWQAYDAYQVTRDVKGDELNVAISAFNTDLASRYFGTWFEYHITGQTVTTTEVLASAPGQIVAGGNMNLVGSVTNRDSLINAGGTLDHSGDPDNISTQGTMQTAGTGEWFFSFTEYHGGFHGSKERKNTEPTPYSEPAIISSFNLPITPVAPPSVDASPTGPLHVGDVLVPIPGATAASVNIDGRGPAAVILPAQANLAGATASINSPLNGGTVNGGGTAGTVNGIDVPSQRVTPADTHVSGGSGATGDVSPGGVDGAAPNSDPTHPIKTGPPTDGGKVNIASTNGAGVSGTHTNGVASDAASTAGLSGPLLHDALPGSVIAAATRGGQQQAIATVHTQFATLVTTSPLTFVGVQPKNATVQLQGANVAPAAKVSGPAGINLAGPNTITLTSSAPVVAPASLLFHINRTPGAHYLVETDPAFTDERTWLGSSYFLQQLNMDPDRLGKRYGDGFAEQREIDDQIMALTGRRFLSGYSATETEYQALMDAGVAYAQQYQFAPGVALSAEQMALLTTDIVWLQTENVTLPDGSVTQVIVPQVYLRRPKDGDLRPTGSLIAASDIDLRGTKDSLNNSGTIMAYGDPGQGSGRLTIDANEVANSGTLAGHTITVAAAGDIKNLGGAILGITTPETSTIALSAGRDITLVTTTQTGVSANGSRTSADRLATVTGGTLDLIAGRDLTLTGAKITASQDANLTAGRDITASSIALDYSFHVGVASGSRVSEQSTTQALASITAGRDLKIGAVGELTLKGSNLTAGNDMALTAANIAIASAKKLVAYDNLGVESKAQVRNAAANEMLAGGNLTAGNSLTIEAINALPATGSGNIKLSGVSLTAGTDAAKLAADPVNGGTLSLKAANDISVSKLSTDHSEIHDASRSSSSLFASSSSQWKQTSSSTAVEMSSLSGERVQLQAGQDLAIKASAIAGGGDVSVTAGGKLDIGAATQTQSFSDSYRQQSSGLFSDGASITLGSRSLSQTGDTSSVSHIGSNVGSLTGDVTLLAGMGYQQLGSNVIALQGNIAITAPKIDIGAVTDTAQSQQTFAAHQSGLTLSVSSPVITAVQTAQSMSEAAGNTSDPRMKALAAATTALAASNAYDAIKAGQGSSNPADQVGGINVSLSLGSSKSQSQSSSQSSTAVGSNLAAGNNLSLIAIGGDLTAIGSSLFAGNDASLAASGNVNLLAAQSTSSRQSTSSGSSASVGVGLALGGTQNGFTLQAGASQNKGNSNGQDLTWTNTSVAAGNTLTLASGQDTTLKGAMASGSQVVANVGGSLSIESLQDTSSDQSKSSNTGFSMSLCIPPLCTGVPSSGSVSAGKSNIDANYASVTQQSAILAGDGGFQVNVAGNTDLKGGAITSTQTAIDQNKNRFATGTLTTADTQNQANYQATAAGINFGSGVSLDGKLAPIGTGAGIGSDQGSAGSTTLAAISGIAGNTAARTGDAQTGIAKIFDADKVQKEINAKVAITQQFGQQASKAVTNYVQDQRTALQKAATTATETGKKDIQAQINDLNTQERVLNILIGAVTGQGGAAITKEALSTAADQMRQITAKDSQIFPGITDGKTVLSNVSGQSEGVRGDGAKYAGTRVDLDLLCGQDNSRCKTELDSNGNKQLALDAQKRVQFDPDAAHMSLEKFLTDTDDGKKLAGAGGGIQGWKGTLLGVPYLAGSWQDKLLEAFSGTHDVIGGKITGLYDAQGNQKRGMSDAEKKLYDYVVSPLAIVPSAPFAAAEALPPEVWNAIATLLKAAR